MTCNQIPRLAILIAIPILTSLVSCQSTRIYSQPVGTQEYNDDQGAVNVAFFSPQNDSDANTDDVIEAWNTQPDSLISPILAEAEALYSTGVIFNLNHRWHDAQVAFEQAVALLGELEPFELTRESDSIAVHRLLQEITTDYRITLTALGTLDPNTSSSAVILGFQDDNEIVEPDKLELPAPPEPVQYDFPIELNDKVRKCIVYYQTVARDPLEKFLTRAGRYLPMMKKIVASYGIPTDLAYLPLVESGFNNKAYSYAHAAGPWQFIASTGRKYGLHRNWWYDERRDFEKSTHAACQYLKDLYERFGDWKIALASYNAGEGRLSRQMKRQKTRDFWKLKLPRQTRNYVPLYMASLLIAKDPETYGFHIEPDTPIDFDWVATNKALELKDVARAIGCSTDELADLNPELRRLVTPPDVKPYRFRVPTGSGESFAAAYKSIRASTRTEWVRHKVRRGETLSNLSRRYGVRVTEIVRHNKLRSRHRISVGQTLVIPVPMAYADNRSSAPSASKSTARSSGGSTGRYTVKRGESLWKLAKKFGTTTSAIRRANSMGTRSKLIAGQSITIPGRMSYSGTFVYTIRRGDTIDRIARKFGISVRRIMGTNSLKNPNRIYVGQRLTIPRGM